VFIDTWKDMDNSNPKTPRGRARGRGKPMPPDQSGQRPVHTPVRTNCQQLHF